MAFADFPFMLLIALAAAFCLALAALTRANPGASGRRPARGLHPLAWLLAGCVLAWTVSAALLRLHAQGGLPRLDALALERVQAYLAAAQALAFLLLTRRFVQPDPAARARLDYALAAAGAIWLAAGVVFGENLPGLPDPLFYLGARAVVRAEAVTAWLALGWLGCMLSAALTGWQARKPGAPISVGVPKSAGAPKDGGVKPGSRLSPLHRNRRHYWTAALALLAAGHLLAFALPRPPLLAGALTAALTMLGALTAAYAQSTHYLADLRSAARRAAIFAVLALAVSVLYGLAFGGLLLALRLLPGDPARQSWIAAGAALALVTAALLRPLIGALDRLVRRPFSGAAYDARRTLSEYSASISNVLDMELLATIAIGLISEAFEISRGALIAVEPLVALPLAGEDGPSNGPRPASAEMPTQQRGGYRLAPISGMGDALPEGVLPPDSPAAAILRTERRPLTQFDIDLHPRLRAMQPAERAWWAGLTMDLYVPIYVKETWIGLLALGPKPSGDRYFDEDLSFLQTLADQTAVAFENARLFAHLKQRNAENERLNAELTAANRELSQLDQAKSNFINIASHELRTPLTQIMGYNEILADMVRFELSMPDALSMTEAVRKAARRLEEIVDTMFDVSKLDTRTLDLAFDPVPLGMVVTAAGEVWREGMQARGLRLEVSGVEGLPLVRGDAKRLTQVFANLIQNAIRATPDGGLITVSGQLVEQEPGWIDVTVADTGIGIDADDLERIFGKFYRVGNVLLHSTGETKFKGAGPGLGLTIARGVVEAHGGRIWAESPGRDETACPGARLHVLLPVGTELPGGEVPGGEMPRGKAAETPAEPDEETESA